MRGRFILGCIFAVLFCTLRPALAHDHCEVDANSHERHQAKLDVSGQIPDTNAQPGSHKGLHSSCGMRHMTSTKHCNMGDCYLKCGKADPSGASNITWGQEFAEATNAEYSDYFYQFRFQLPTQESTLRISIPPNPRPPSA